MDTRRVAATRAAADRAAERAAKMVADAQADYGRAVQDLIDQHGATAVARELGITRGRIYQIAAKARGRISRVGS